MQKLWEIDEELYLKTLPTYLRNDILALLQGEKDNSSFLDCLSDEVYGSINSAYWGNEISEEDAQYLRRRYLGI